MATGECDTENLLILQKPSNYTTKVRAFSSAKDLIAMANTQWKRYLGLRVDTSYIVGYYCEYAIQDQEQNGLGAYKLINFVLQKPSECSHPDAVSCTTTPNLKHYITEVPNDGVVTAQSQIGYLGRVGIELMPKTNHMQERNVISTSNRLNELFEGVYSRDFRLKIR